MSTSPVRSASSDGALVELASERVILRQLEPDSAAMVADFHRRNREHLAPWSPPAPPGLETEELWRDRLAAELRAAQDGTGLRLHLFERCDPGVVIGHAGLSQIFRGAFESAYLGYALDGARQGRGLMTEALRLLVAHAFGPMRLHRLQANHVPENHRSAAVLARLGFQREGLSRDYLFIGGRWRDHVLTALLNPGHPGPAGPTP